MIGKLYNILAVFSLATLLATGGFCAYLAGSGRLNTARAATIAATLRGELDDVGRNAPQEPAAAPEPNEPRGPTPAEVGQDRRRDQLRGLMLERARRDVEARQQLLDQALHSLIAKQEVLAEETATAARQAQNQAAPGQTKGFEQELEYISGLQPKQAKEHVLYLFKKQPADAVRLLMHLDVGRGKRILAQFKTPDELQIMSQLLEQLRVQNAEGYANESGTTAGAASP